MKRDSIQIYHPIGHGGDAFLMTNQKDGAAKITQSRQNAFCAIWIDTGKGFIQ